MNDLYDLNTVNGMGSYINFHFLYSYCSGAGNVWEVKKIATDVNTAFYISTESDNGKLKLTNESESEMEISPSVVSLTETDRTNRINLTLDDYNRKIEYANVGDDQTAVTTTGHAFGSTSVFWHERLDYIKVTWSKFLDE